VAIAALRKAAAGAARAPATAPTPTEAASVLGAE
jgi:hypothetical protein